jgi:hypothetical protein
MSIKPLPRTSDPDQFRALCEVLQACEAADPVAMAIVPTSSNAGLLGFI